MFAARRPDVRSWGCSLFLHLAVLGMACWVVPHEVASFREQPFQWDVALVASQDARASTPVPTAARSRSFRTPAPVQISRPAESPSTSVDSPQAEPIHPIEPRAKPDPEPIPAPRIAVAAEPPPPSIHPPEIEASSLASAVEDAMTRPEKESVHPLAQASAAAQPVEPPPAAIPESTPVQAVVTALREEEPSVPAAPREPPAETGAKLHEPVQVTQLSQPVLVEGTANPASEQSGRMPVKAGVSPAPAKADFGWLVQALWSKVAEYKRYPSEARMKHWQGKVVVRVVIDEHGHLLEARIASSSGHEALDEDAIAVITRSCPLALPQPLGQHQVVLRVPIQYRLDS